MSETPYVPLPIGPDPARDARVAARRAADARRAGAALDKMARATVDLVYDRGWSDGYAAAGLHHNRHYDVAGPRHCGACNSFVMSTETECTHCGQADPRDVAWRHDLCGRAYWFVAGYDPSDPNDPCPGCGACSGSWAVVP